MTLPTLRRRASLSRTALLLVAASASACAGKRPTFGPFVERDAGGSDDETETSTTTGNSTTDGGSTHDVTDTDETGDSGAGAVTTDDNVDVDVGDTTSAQTTSGTEATATDGTEPDESDTSGVKEETDAGTDTEATDDGGVECSAGHFADRDGNCQQWAECGAGTYIASPGTAISDQQCGACEEGTYSDVSNADACISWDHCGWFETSKAGTAENNVECLVADRFDQFGTDLGDTVVAMAANTAGKVAVAGVYLGLPNHVPDAFVRVYTQQGEVDWKHQFGTAVQDQATGVTLQPDGSVVVVGYTWGILAGESSNYVDMFVRRYAPDGEELWTRQVDIYREDDFASAVASDAAGNSVVVGSTWGLVDNTSTYFREAIVRKYDGEGDVLWTRQFDALSAEGVAVGSDGSIAVVGSVVDGSPEGSTGSNDIFLRLYATDGELLWARQFGSDKDDFSRAVSFTPSGHIAIGGHTLGKLSGDHLGEHDAFLRLYEPDGTVVWTRQFGSEQEDFLKAIATSKSDHIVVAGETMGALSGDSFGLYDYFVRGYDLSGAPLWTRQLGTDREDSAMALVLVGQSEFVAVGGNTTGALSGDNLGSADAFVGVLRIP